MEKQIYQITITPTADVPLDGEGSIEWQLKDLLMDIECPDNVMELIDGYVDEVEFIKKEAN
tara:strand:+ start:268 stop:450 length:183 start_codon:yes stop_codon:yes gene_type:complete